MSSSDDPREANAVRDLIRRHFHFRVRSVPAVAGRPISWAPRFPKSTLGTEAHCRWVAAAIGNYAPTGDDERSSPGRPTTTPCQPSLVMSASVSSMDAAWSNRNGTRQRAKFPDYALAAGAGEYAWGYGMYSIPLPDGRTFWTTDDTFQGPINTDGSRSGSLIRCAYVVQATGNGAITQTIDEPDNNLALLHGVVEGNNVRVLAVSIVDDHFEILPFNATTLARSDGGVAQQRPELPGMTEGGAAWGFHIQPHVDGYPYIYGPGRFGPFNLSEGTKVARVATASGVLAPWEFHTGTDGGLPRWSSDPTKAVFMGIAPTAMASGPGKVVLSYNLTAFGRSGQDPLVEDAWCYGPRFFEVDLNAQEDPDAPPA